MQMLRQALYRFSPKWVLQLLDIKKTKQDKRFEHWLSTSKAVAKDLVQMKMESGDSVEKESDFMSVLCKFHL